MNFKYNLEYLNIKSIMLVGFSLFNYIYLLFQSLSQTNFEKHLAIYENNVTIVKNFDFLTLYYHSYNYDLELLIKVGLLASLFMFLFLNKMKSNRLQNDIKNKDKNISELSIENTKLLNKIELLEENYNVIKNLLLDYDSKVNSDEIDDIFNLKNIDKDKTCEDQEVETEEQEEYEEDSDDEDYVDEGEDSDEDDDDIYEKYDKLLEDYKKLKIKLQERDDKINKIYDYTNLDFCRSARIVTYIRNEIKKNY